MKPCYVTGYNTLYICLCRYYIAFENTYCLDYVSEKLYRSLLFDMIPIVYGNVDYTAYSPKRSVIDILDFPTPKALAKYLIYLADDHDEYSRYFEWKKNLEIIQNHPDIFGPAFCRLCEILHDSDYKYSDYRDISSWWLAGTCDMAFMATFRAYSNW